MSHLRLYVRNLEFDSAAFDDLSWWVQRDRKMAIRVLELIQELQREPLAGSRVPVVDLATSRSASAAFYNHLMQVQYFAGKIHTFRNCTASWSP